MRSTFFISIFSVLLILACRQSPTRNFLTGLTLEGGFDKDSVTILFLNDTIINNEVISSSKVLDLSELRLEFYNYSDRVIIEDGHKKVILESQGLHHLTKEGIVLIVNQRPFYLKVDTALGKYIGISKLASDSLDIVYSSDPRYYD